MPILQPNQYANYLAGPPLDDAADLPNAAVSDDPAWAASLDRGRDTLFSTEYSPACTYGRDRIHFDGEHPSPFEGFPQVSRTPRTLRELKKPKEVEFLLTKVRHQAVPLDGR